MDLFGFLKTFYPIQHSTFALLTSQFQSASFKKGDWITQPGQVQRNLYFVKTGVQTSYFETDNKQHVLAFTYPPGPCAIPESFSLQTPSKYYLLCITDSDFDYISFDNLQKLFDQSQELERLFRKMTDTVLAGVISRHMELHSLSIEERFKSFMQRSPHLLQVIPHKFIASYLNIDPTNFSKLYNSIRI